MVEIEVARAGRLTRGDVTRGTRRERAFETNDAVVARSTVRPGVVSAWHHHGSRSLYGYIAAGRFRLEYGPNGKLSVDLSIGDFFHVPPGLVHRDVNPDEKEDVIIVNVSVGSGPAIINVAEP